MMGTSHTWRRHLPRTSGDCLALAFMVIAVHVIVLFELLVIVPSLHRDSETPNFDYWSHVLLGFFLYLNVMVSIALSVLNDTTSGSTILPSILKPGWRFCSACEANAPPRSHHCWMCRACVLKRDHHCLFTGKCVGFTNHRYFINMVGYLCIGALYCNYLNMEFVWEILGGLSIKAILTMVMPIIAWAIGLTETYTFTVAFISSTCVFGFLLLGTLLFYHLVNIFNGQTTYERAQGIRDYNCGWKENLRQVFGEKWYIAWASPVIPSNMPGDGIDFPKKAKYENVKDM